MTIYLLTVALLNLSLGYALATAVGHAFDGDSGGPREPGDNDDSVPPPFAPEASSAASLADDLPFRQSQYAEQEFTVPSEQVQATLDEFEAEYERFRDLLADVDQKVRACSESPQPETVAAYKDDLQGANQIYLQNQSSVLERLRQAEDASGPDPLTGWLTGAVTSQNDQIRVLSEQVQAISVEANLVSSCQQLLDRTEELASANGVLRDVVVGARLEIARRDQEGGSPNITPADCLTNMASRAALERALAEWWREDAQRRQPLTVGLIEIDRLADLNEQFGLQTGNKVLQAVAAIVAGVTRGDDLAARSSGQRLLIMFPETAPRSATSALERVRQMVCTAQFATATEVVPVSVTCAVAEATVGDSVESLLSRVEATLAEASRYGGNRTFLNEGKFAAPVAPPQFVLEPRVLTV